MDNIFKQSKQINKIIFDTYFKNIALFDEILPEEMLGVSSSPVNRGKEDVWRIEVFVGDAHKYKDIVMLLEQFAKNADIAILSEIRVEEVEDRDWIADHQNQLKPIIIDNFFISNRAHIDSCPEGKTKILIDAHRAFGTGGHETTSGCIEEMLRLKAIKPKRILDIGTGTGVLSLVAEKIWPDAEIFACDIDEISIKIAKQNKIANNSTVNFFVNRDFLLQEDAIDGKKFDLIVSNILAKPLIDFVATVRRLIAPGGQLILSGFLENQARAIVEKYSEMGFKEENRKNSNNWVTTTFKVKTS